jgi:exosome complex RNA-binding protein Rrp42 (RNase PH superfamily)
MTKLSDLIIYLINNKMKSQISEPERAFILEGFRQNTCRRDGRTLMDHRLFKLEVGVVPHGFGSSQLIFGE